MRLYVGNLPFQATDSDVRDFFARVGITVDNVNLMRDRLTGDARGFGFVEIADQTVAHRAIETCNGQDLKGRPLTVNEARATEKGGRR